MLNALNRDLNEKTKHIRERGYIPANIHHAKLEKSIPVEVYVTDFKRFIDAKKHLGTFELNLDGEINNCKLSEVQIDSIDGFIHIDFLLV